MSQSPASPGQPALGALNVDITFLLLGLYGWEYVQSLGIEYTVLCGRSSFRVPLVPYIIGRISLLCYLVLLVIQSSPFPMTAFTCNPAATFVSLFAVLALGCASTIFMIRSWLIWKDSRLVHILQGLLALGQWTLLVLDVAGNRLIRVDGGCEPVIRHPKVDAASIIYSMCFDLVMFVLSVVGLARQQSGSPLAKCLRTQGVLYFAIAGIAYIPPTVLVMLKLDINNSLLLNIFTNLALTASTIVSSRSVRSLLSLKTCTTTCGTGESNMALTTQIMVGTSMTGESTHV